MARANQRSSSRSTTGRAKGGARSSGGNGSNSKSKTGSRSRSKRQYPDYSIVDPKDIPEGPDVLLDVPVVKVDEVELEVEDLRAQVAVSAEVRKLLQLSVGADASLGKVELTIEGVEAQALLKARLDNVGAILERVLMSLDRNPELLASVGRAAESVGYGAGDMLGETGEAVEDVGSGAGQAVGQVGQGAGQAVEGVGQGASRGVEGVGQGAKQGTQKLAKGGQ